MRADRPEARSDRAPLLLAGIALGIGLGAFVDGIVFHQILQWHGMLSHRLHLDTLANAKINMFWDGVFHAFAWTTTMAGVALLWRCGRRAGASWSGSSLVGAMLMGWGAFNLCEGIVDHHLLHLHQVLEAPTTTPWDHAFLVFGAALVVVGWLVSRPRHRATRHDRGTTASGRPVLGR
jgi:uncharacterized membrane protein